MLLQAELAKATALWGSPFRPNRTAGTTLPLLLRPNSIEHPSICRPPLLGWSACCARCAPRWDAAPAAPTAPSQASAVCLLSKRSRVCSNPSAVCCPVCAAQVGPGVHPASLCSTSATVRADFCRRAAEAGGSAALPQPRLAPRQRLGAGAVCKAGCSRGNRGGGRRPGSVSRWGCGEGAMLSMRYRVTLSRGYPVSTVLHATLRS